MSTIRHQQLHAFFILRILGIYEFPCVSMSCFETFELLTKVEKTFVNQVVMIPDAHFLHLVRWLRFFVNNLHFQRTNTTLPEATVETTRIIYRIFTFEKTNTQTRIAQLSSKLCICFKEKSKIHSCRPRGWSGARVGVGILKGTIIFQDLKDYKK